ncbi:unnamed protein product, partial [Brassica rapa]
VASGYAVGLLGAGLELVDFVWSVSFCGSSSHLKLSPVAERVGSTVWRSALRFSFLWSSSWQFSCVKVDGSNVCGLASVGLSISLVVQWSSLRRRMCLTSPLILY